MSRLAVMHDAKKEVKNSLISLHQMCNVVEDSIYTLQTSFIYNSIKHLDESRAIVADVSAGLRQIDGEINVLLPGKTIRAYL
jgi:hypothetical protein